MRDSASSARWRNASLIKSSVGWTCFVRRHFHGGSGDHFRSGQSLIAQSAAERILHQQLLQLQVGLCHGQGLLVLRDGALRADDFDGRQAADFHLLLGVGERLLGEGQRFFLHAHVLVGIDQIPIHVFDLVDRGDDLQAEGDVGEFAVVLGDANEARVRGESKSLQKMLRDGCPEVGVQSRAQGRKEAIRGLPRVIEAHGQIRSPLKACL